MFLALKMRNTCNIDDVTASKNEIHFIMRSLNRKRQFFFILSWQQRKKNVEKIHSFTRQQHISKAYIRRDARCVNRFFFFCVCMCWPFRHCQLDPNQRRTKPVKTTTK